jgi:hypothetical protein
MGNSSFRKATVCESLIRATNLQQPIPPHARKSVMYLVLSAQSSLKICQEVADGLKAWEQSSSLLVA